MRSDPAVQPDFDTLIERNQSKSVTYGVFGAAINILFETMADTAKAVRDMTTRSNAAQMTLETRVAELEARATLDYKGVWNPQTEYRRGDCVTRDGSIWHCQRNDNTGMRPGSEGDGWRLAVKRGADGKNGRDPR